MPLRDLRIVAIDDTTAIRTFLRLTLESEGAEFYGAGTADEGLSLCKKVQPNLVVLDLGLPDRDGLDILPEIKQNSEGEHSPQVIILTVRKGQELVQKVLDLGADAYLSKPFMVEDLLELVQERLEEIR